MNNMWTRQSLSSRTAKRIFSALSEHPPSTIQLPTRAWSSVQGTRNTNLSRHFSSIHHPTTATVYSQRASSSPISSRLQFFKNNKNNRSHRRFNHTKPDNQASSSSTSFSARWKKLSKEYGWAAVGIYLALSALDFPFCFAAVRLLGVERIGYLEHLVVDSVKSALGWAPPLPSGESATDGDALALTTDTTTATEDGAAVVYDHGVVEAQEKNASEQASIWTQLALAYAIHKSFIFIRIPLTAAITPKIVKILRRWGWDIGKKVVPKVPKGK